MEPPKPPEASQCCGSGCDPCIFDVYEQQLKRYVTNKSTISNTDNGVTPPPPCISQTAYSVFQLINIKQDSKDAYLYTFKYKRRLKSDTDATETKCYLMMNTGQHLLLRGGDINHFTRAYTPLTYEHSTCSFTVLIKLYDHGKMSGFIRGLSLHSKTYWRGAYGDFKLSYGLKHILMICQGTGVAPMYSIINNIVQNEDCYTFLKLFYCCRSFDTIHLRNQIYELSKYWNFTYDVFLSEYLENFERKYNENIHTRKLHVGDMNDYLKTIDCNRQFQILLCGSLEFQQKMLDNIKTCNINQSFVYSF